MTFSKLIRISSNFINDFETFQFVLRKDKLVRSAGGGGCRGAKPPPTGSCRFPPRAFIVPLSCLSVAILVAGQLD